jgi:para-nitrobenzyl esterase
LRVFLVVAALVIAVTMIEAYIAYVDKFTTDTFDRMPLTYVDETAVDTERVVDTASGRVVGRPHPNGVIQFHGIPVAQPPVGELRFAPPRPAPSWSGILDGTGVGPRCLQEDEPLRGIWPGDQSEDCLWLSVSTPEIDDGRRPVIVWIHGGGLYAGGAGEDTYDGAHLAARGDLVEVNIQYRLGVWGWLDVSHLGGDDVARSAVNGQLDQRLALEWVQHNIARFGGDPDNVTLAGHSAGAYAVASLMTVPEAAPLFHRAVLMSGAFTPGSPTISKRAVTDKLLDALGTETLAELRALPGRRLLDAQNRLADEARSLGYPDLTVFLEMPPPGPMALRQAGRSGKPLLLGATAHEYDVFKLLLPARTDRGRRLAEDRFGAIGLAPEDVATLVAILRPHYPDRSEDDLYLDVLTAVFVAYPQRVLASAWTGAGAGVYRYVFAGTSATLPTLGAFRGLDLPHVFGTLDGANAQQLLGENVSTDLSENMMDALISFARDGRPAIPGLPAWPLCSDEPCALVRFGAATEIIEDPTPWMDELAVTLEGMLEDS